MNFDFPYYSCPEKVFTNYELYLMPNGIYRVKSVTANNYLYPVYYIKDGESYLVSTSVYALIRFKNQFIRNPRFQTTRFFRSTFLTIDEEIMRSRTLPRRSTYELSEKRDLVELAARLIQEYVSEIELRYPEHVHIVLMGGKDSQALLLANRKSRWIVVSGEPNAPLNKEFIKQNRLKIDRFIAVTSETNDRFLLEETIASDCFYSLSNSRWVAVVHDIAKEYDGQAVVWYGSAGDAILSYHHAFHKAVDYFAQHELYVGMAMGILHQLLKNLLNVPVLSPYQSPQFLDQLFYRFDPYFVIQTGDIRPEIGKLLLGSPIWYPDQNPTPPSSQRNRFQSIKVYVNQLRADGIPCKTNQFSSWAVGKKETVLHFIDEHSSKRRTRLSKILFPLRREVGKAIPMFRNTRYNIGANEIR